MKEDRWKFNIQCTRIFAIYVENIDVLFRAFSSSLSSMLDSQASGLGSIPDSSSVNKLVVASSV